jgi:hypothetical protein
VACCRHISFRNFPRGTYRFLESFGRTTITEDYASSHKYKQYAKSVKPNQPNKQVLKKWTRAADPKQSQPPQLPVAPSSNSSFHSARGSSSFYPVQSTSFGSASSSSSHHHDPSSSIPHSSTPPSSAVEIIEPEPPTTSYSSIQDIMGRFGGTKSTSTTAAAAARPFPILRIHIVAWCVVAWCMETFLLVSFGGHSILLHKELDSCDTFQFSNDHTHTHVSFILIGNNDTTT